MQNILFDFRLDDRCGIEMHLLPSDIEAVTGIWIDNDSKLLAEIKKKLRDIVDEDDGTRFARDAEIVLQKIKKGEEIEEAK